MISYNSEHLLGWGVTTGPLEIPAGRLGSQCQVVTLIRAISKCRTVIAPPVSEQKTIVLRKWHI